MLRHFDVTLVSHHLGCRKPEPAIFEQAVVGLDVSPDAIMLFDDDEANVAAAQAVGIRGCHVRGVDEVRAALSRVGVLAGA